MTDTTTTPYSPDFYRGQRGGSRRSAQEIVPIVLGLVYAKSVIDVGCGVGTWLSVFAEHGIDDAWGVDWHTAIEMLEIPRERFLSRDLTAPLDLNRQFDLVVSLEVGEHLPENAADSYVHSLTTLAPVVLFSAAVPYQGGTHHVNEQWPAYWLRLFASHGYVPVDCIRGRVWDNERVEWFYAQNTLIFVRETHIRQYPALADELQKANGSPLALVHPRGYTAAQRLLLTLEDIASVVGCHETLILVDDQLLVKPQLAVRRTVRFMERDGGWCEQPASDDVAIAELRRLRRAGARFMVFLWPAFWWLEYYTGLDQYLRRECRCVLKNDRLVVFALRSPGAGAADP